LHYWQENEELVERSRVLHLLLGSATSLSITARTREIQADRNKQRVQRQQQQPSALFLPAPIYLEILDDVLLLVYKLLTQLIEAAEQQQPVQASSSSSSSASKGRSSRPSQASNSGPSVQELNAAFNQLVKGGMQGLLETYAALASSMLTEYAGLGSLQQQSPTPRASLICCSEAPALREDAAVWLQHAAQMCQVLEAYVRAAARS
jgi:hypothetical protein